MAQEFHVVRCFSCESFQVQQVKKVNRWSCRMCGEKQTLKKEFGRGGGADCRRHVQRLNAMRGAMAEERDARSLWTEAEAEEHRDHQEESHVQESHAQESHVQESHAQESHVQESHVQESHAQLSRWSKYLDAPTLKEEEEVEEEEENVLMDRQRLQGNNKTDRKRKRACGGGDRWTREQSNCSRPSTKPEQPPVSSPTNLQQTKPQNQPTTGPQRTRPSSPQNPSLQWTRPTSPQRTRPTSPQRTRPTSPQNLSLRRTRPTSPQRTHPTSPQNPGLRWTHPTSPQNLSLQRTRPTSPQNPKTSSLQREKPHSGLSSRSRWSVFLSPDCQAEDREEEPAFRKDTQKVGGAVSAQGQPVTKPRPLLPVSSMFESGDDFSFDDML